MVIESRTIVGGAAALAIVGVELAHGPRPGLVDDLGAPEPGRLEGAEHRPRRVGEDGQAAGVAQVERLREHAPARAGRPGGGVVGGHVAAAEGCRRSTGHARRAA